jgi:hypothetical protein
MGRRASLGLMEPKNNTESSHGVHSVLLGLWIRGYAPHRCRIRIPEAKGLQRKNNDATREDVLDQLEEACDVALLYSARYQ